MSNYRAQYQKMRRTRIEKICILIQIAAVIVFFLITPLQMAFLDHAGPGAMYRTISLWLIAYVIPIAILIVCAIIRSTEKGKRIAFDVTHRTSSKYREEAYVMAQRQKAQAASRQTNGQKTVMGQMPEIRQEQPVEQIEKKLKMEDYFPELHQDN